ncbi:MAG: alpha/beta fold hydrolase [Pseudomonadota bacterium]
MKVREQVVIVGALQFPVREIGAEQGMPVLMLHGFPDCFHSYDAQLDAFAQAGFRVIVPALRGYAATNLADDGDYYLTTLVKDLVGLMDAMAIPRAHLIGHDWGAAVGWLAVAEHPQRFFSFASLAIPPVGGLARAALRYPVQLRKSWYMAFFQLRGLADRVLARNDFAFVDKLWRDWSPGWDRPQATMERVKETFRQPGVPRAALGYYRCLFDVFAAPNRRAQMLIRQLVRVPVLVLHGHNDGCMDSRLPAAAVDPKQFPAGIRLVTVDDAGHFLHQEQPAKVNTLLLDFVRGHGV